MFTEAIETILKENCTPDVVRAIEGGDPGLRLWAAFSTTGFLDLLAPEDQGGANLSLPELFPILVRFGAYAVPLPIAQTVVARALVAPEVRLPEGLLTIAPIMTKTAEGTLICPLVPFGAIAQFIVASDGNELMLLDASTACRKHNLSRGSQAATLIFPERSDSTHLRGDASGLAPLSASLHSALITGAMLRVFEMTLGYCNDRSQFGRPLGKFQAIQHQLSLMAERIAAVSIATEASFDSESRRPLLLRAAMAKAYASEAVPFVANTAHALHGAIGVTEEYDLQLFTRRLHEWRMAHGAEAYWNRIVGEAILADAATVAEFIRSN